MRRIGIIAVFIFTAVLVSPASGDPATVQDPDNLTQVASGTASATSSVVWGVQAVTLVPSSKKVTFNFFNLTGNQGHDHRG